MNTPSAPSSPGKRLVIIGTGSIGERHLRCFQATGRAEVSACEPNDALRSSISGRYGCPGFASLEEAAQSGPWDAAIICTPAHTHLSIALKCVERGWSVLIEKPLSTSPDGLDALKSALARKGALALVAYVYRANPMLRHAKELLECRKLGRIAQITLLTGQHFPTFRPAYRTIYYARHATGGGAIQDALTHSIHTIEWLAGPIRRLYTDAAHQVLDGVDVEDTVNLVARIPEEDGREILVSVACNQFQAPSENCLTFHGEHASLRLDLGNAQLGILHSGEAEWRWQEFPKDDRDAPFIRQASAFLDALDGLPSPLATLAEAEQSMRVNIAALQSAAERREITL